MAKFLGIRYAQADRFQIAEPLQFAGVPSQEGEHGPHHFQMGFGPSAPVNPGGSDDCLHLDVWTPPGSPGKKPVLVWIYGGGFEGGSTRAFNAELLSVDQDVLVVVINYRVGFLGFGYLPGELPTNLGLRDVITAIKWVAENIEAFGGDRSNITLIGESAGGFLATAAAASRELNEMDFNLIAMSGAASRLVLIEDIERLTRKWLAELGSTSVADTLSIPIETLLSAQRDVIPRDFGLRNGARVNALGVVLDNQISDGVLSRHPFQTLTDSISRVLLTTVQREMSTMRRYMPDNFEKISREDLAAEVSSFAQSAKRGLEITDQYLAVHPDCADAREQILSDFIYRLPAARLARARKQKTWSIDFPPEIAAGHGSDVVLLFPNSPEQAKLGQKFRRQVGLFAHQGNPGQPDEVNFDWLIETWQGVERI